MPFKYDRKCGGCGEMFEAYSHGATYCNVCNKPREKIKASETEIEVKYYSERGETTTRLYNIWRGMLKRCYYPKIHKYEYYGGRGIEVCPEWKNNYTAFKKWAFENGYNDILTIDRIDSDGNYCPENCRWRTWNENRKSRKYRNKWYYRRHLAKSQPA